MTVISKEKPEVTQLLLMHTVCCMYALMLLLLVCNVHDLAVCAKGEHCDSCQQGEACGTTTAAAAYSLLFGRYGAVVSAYNVCWLCYLHQREAC